MCKRPIKSSALAVLLTTLGCQQQAEEPVKAPVAETPTTVSQSADTSESAPVGGPFWGDTHLHTSNSFDVYLFGTPSATPETAYRFAKGEPVTSPTTGETWQLERPLDFLVIADHAEMMGNAARVFAGDPDVADTSAGQALLAEGGSGQGDDLLKAYHYVVNVGAGVMEDGKYRLSPRDIYMDLHGGDKRVSVWQEIVNVADRHNDPGEFTTFIGWEWSSHPGGANLHRVVFTPANADIAAQFLPYSQMESDRPEDLWAWLEATKAQTGADFIAMPHNANVSMGRMFQLEDSDGNPIDADYARRRMEWERVVEMTQIKGDSETHPLLSPVDEFADFETWNFVMIPSGPTPDPVAAEYVRAALRRGLEIEARTGVNPYKFGMIGSTDSHTGLSTASETAFAGKGQKDSRPELRSKPTGLGSSRGWDMGAAGLVAAWATANTREAIFDAFKRRQVYATTGTRITLRFFAASDIELGKLTADIVPPDAAPMGSEISAAADSSPYFLVQALKDPDGANLDRAQIVKGWVDSTGETHEQVFDVAWSGEREMSLDGKLPPVGNTVDLSSGRYTNTIGAPELSAVWSDPDFDRSQSAFYYVRVLEIPTPRYSLLDAIALGIDVADTGRPATLQERAYSSPIWLSPQVR